MARKRLRGQPLSEAELLRKRRYNRKRAERRKMLDCRKSSWMRNSELHTPFKGVYQEARSEWFFRVVFVERAGVARGRVRVYYATLEDVLNEVNPKSEQDLEAFVYKIRYE